MIERQGVELKERERRHWGTWHSQGLLDRLADSRLSWLVYHYRWVRDESRIPPPRFVAHGLLFGQHDHLLRLCQRIGAGEICRDRGWVDQHGTNGWPNAATTSGWVDVGV